MVLRTKVCNFGGPDSGAGDANGDQIDTASKAIVTRTKPSDFPSLLRQKLSTTQTVERHKIQTSQIDPNMDCPECGTIGIRYTEVQMRSADEGSTIIYNCECGHKYGSTVTELLKEVANLFSRWSMNN